VRALLLAVLALVCATPALAQTTPAPETITFEGIGTPIAYVPGQPVPRAARLKKLTLASGGIVRFRTRGGAGYVALVTQFGTTGIVGVTNKGKIIDASRLRYVEMWLRKVRGARFDSFVAMQGGVRVDTKGTTDTADDETIYDNPASGQFQLYDLHKSLYPPNGSSLPILRAVDPPIDPAQFVKDPYDLTTTSLDFMRILILGALVYDDLVVSYGH
jgi:hypothetical protein